MPLDARKYHPKINHRMTAYVYVDAVCCMGGVPYIYWWMLYVVWVLQVDAVCCMGMLMPDPYARPISDP